MKQSNWLSMNVYSDNILSDFLRKQSRGDLHVSIFEYDKELEERKLRKGGI